MSLFTCLHTKKINDKPLVGKNYRLKSTSGGGTKKYGFSDFFSDKQHKNICIFMKSILVWWVSNAPIIRASRWKTKTIRLYVSCPEPGRGRELQLFYKTFSLLIFIKNALNTFFYSKSVVFERYINIIHIEHSPTNG